MRTTLLLLALVVVAVQSQFTCHFCTMTLKSMADSIETSPDVQAQLGDLASSQCDEVPNQTERKACRELLGDHFGDVFARFVANPETTPDALCQKMGYC